MPANLLYHITDKAGTWFQRAEDCTGGRLRLTRPDDTVTLTGPLLVNVSLVAENVAKPVAGGDARSLTREVYSYNLDIPAGYAWTCRGADVAPTGTLGANAGWGVILRPGSQTTPPATQPACDVPCDFAVVNLPDTSAFFPAGCEGCPPGSTVSMPPTCGPALNVPSARGGCVRPRFFNGMLMTREDMETQLRYLRLKNKLHNRAAGAGVVWGLSVGRNGGKVRVEAGYAVDCCGNDLTVTCPYEVDIATLLADPAGCPALTGGPQRMYLLLEYVECPEEPRPVHGDVCSPQTTLCEPSRVRETVRLRLVPPPRDWTPNGPIGTFLGQVAQALPPVLQPLAAAPAARQPLAAQATVPFSVTFAWRPPEGARPQKLQPPAQGEANATGDLPATTLAGRAAITVIAADGFSFAPNLPAPTSDAPGGVTVTTDTAAQKVWQLNLTREQREAALKFNGWKMTRQADGAQVSGSTAMALQLRNGPAPEERATEFHLHVEILPTQILVTPVAEPGPWPCLSEACDPQGKPRFAVLPPWSHPDPNGTFVPGDPKVDLLAAVYALLALDVGRYTDNETAASTRDVQVLTAVYEAAWHVLFRIAPDAQGRQLTEALHQLFRDWCSSLLYPGPTCQGDPHGVVIGCVLVKAGDICEIDSWGGRRWVVHYPLLAYWLEQFGITPPDVLASRVFDLICCIAGHLRTPPPPARYPDEPEGSTTHLTTAAFNAQGSYLVFGSAQDAQARFNDMGVKVQTKTAQTVGLREFIGRVLSAVRGPRQTGISYLLYAPAGFPNVYLAAPGIIGVPTPQPGRVAGLVRPVLAPPAAVPPLLRDFAETLSVELLNAVPLGQVDARNPAVAPLTEAGMTTVGAVLARDPEALLGQVLKGGQAQPLSALLGASENLAATVAKAVAETIQKHHARGLLTRGDFTKADLVGPFIDDLARALANLVPNRDAVAGAVDRAAKAAPGANA
jgi:hypothetical protein